MAKLYISLLVQKCQLCSGMGIEHKKRPENNSFKYLSY